MPPVAVDDGDAKERPARLRLLDMARDLGFCHARIMLERERGDRRAVFVAAADARESDHRTDIGAPVRERALPPAASKVSRCSRIVIAKSSVNVAPPLQSTSPPVIGGKKAISPAPAIRAPFTWARSIAARMTFGFSNAYAYSSPRRQPRHQIADRADAGRRSSTSSSGLPIRSRTQAK